MRYKFLLLIGFFFALAACEKRYTFENFTIGYGYNTCMTGNVVKIMPSEVLDINYLITFDGKYLQDMMIDMIDVPEGMYCNVSERTYTIGPNGEKQAAFHLNLGNVKDTSGTYNLRFVAYTQEGLYHEFVQPIEVYKYSVNSVGKMGYSVRDTLAVDTFKTIHYVDTNAYTMTISPKVGGTANQFVMSFIGTHITSGTFPNVEGTLDPATGWLSFPSQTIFGITFDAFGRFVYHPDIDKFKGFVFYHYLNSGIYYEGQANF